MTTSTHGDVSVQVGADHVATVEIHRPSANFFDVGLIRSLAEGLDAVDADPGAWVVLLCSEGKYFCAGADFGAQSSAEPLGPGDTARLYREAVRLFSARTPLVTAVQGAAIGGGLGLACAADFRVASAESRFSANFARLGFHQGFGLSVTLPAIVGQQRVRSARRCAGHLAGEAARVTEREDAEQVRLRSTEDFAEGIAASAGRREPRFTGR